MSACVFVLSFIFMIQTFVGLQRMEVRQADHAAQEFYFNRGYFYLGSLLAGMSVWRGFEVSRVLSTGLGHVVDDGLH